MILLLHIHESDNLVVATRPLCSGDQVDVAGVAVTVRRDVSLGAKLALHSISRGEKVLKYGEPIGTATCDIATGEYIHTHNLTSDYLPTPQVEVLD
jgi:hypothetical protein